MTWIAGQVVTADELNDNAPQEWQDWTPSFLGGMTVGAGTLTGRYCQHGKTVVFWAKFVLGSGSALTGVPIGTLPVGANGSAETFAVLAGHMVDSGVQNYEMFVRQTQSNGVSIYAMGTSGAYSGTYPFTPGAGDQIEWRGVYEAL